MDRDSPSAGVGLYQSPGAVDKHSCYQRLVYSTPSWPASLPSALHNEGSSGDAAVLENTDSNSGALASLKILV